MTEYPESLALATVSALSVALASYIFLDKAAKTKINAFVLKKSDYEKEDSYNRRQLPPIACC